MAQLITMRHRIKAVETIKKITHAMRLISMSSHSRLKNQKKHLETYRNAFQTLWRKVENVLVEPGSDTTKSPQNPHRLIILTGSQKGLCGPFNSMLFRFFEQEMLTQPSSQSIIAVGKHAIEYCRARKLNMIASYNDFTTARFVTIAQALTDLLIASPIAYSQVTFYGNYQKNFFIQRPQATIVFPLPDMPKQEDQQLQQPVEYLFEQSPEELGSTLRHLMILITLQELLYDSLLAEQAARFISMDNSTRNADNLLVSMKLEYNKARQAAITQELTELSSNS
ncbi:F0F1 ATP synthase subunit gamma [Candidatus Dependentiae bacterium]|nr:F0F1 ATP synthase subunit gamma [Candidatus Dependentiae bacterium]